MLALIFVLCLPRRECAVPTFLGSISTSRQELANNSSMGDVKEIPTTLRLKKSARMPVRACDIVAATRVFRVPKSLTVKRGFASLLGILKL